MDWRLSKWIGAAADSWPLCLRLDFGCHIATLTLARLERQPNAQRGLFHKAHYGSEHLHNRRTRVLSLEDCLDFSDLGAGEFDANATHEHVPLMVAAEIGSNLLKTADGIRCLETFFLETAEKARLRGSLDDAGRYLAAYREFNQSLPGCSSTFTSSSPSSS